VAEGLPARLVGALRRARTDSVAEGFTCAAAAFNSACVDLPEYQGSGYCVLHYPSKEKNKEDFLKVKERKLARND
jgi:hypothetical protein